jgi:hypothetical protein
MRHHCFGLVQTMIVNRLAGDGLAIVHGEMAPELRWTG